MVFRLISIILFSILASCTDTYLTINNSSKITLPRAKFPEFSNLIDQGNINFLDPVTSNSEVRAISMDEDGYLYIAGAFIGETSAGATSENQDMFILKLNRSGEIVWSIHFDSNHPMVSDASALETTMGVHYDKNSKMVYLYGVSQGSFAETNTSGNNDIVIIKMTSNGSVIWVRQYGEETEAEIANSFPAVDLSYEELIGQLQTHPSGDLVLSYQTNGNFFEPNANLTTSDMGVMKISPATGDIISGIQFGATQETQLPYVGADLSRGESVTSGTFSFDGNKIVVPFRTTGSVGDMNPNTVSVAGYFVLSADLSIDSVYQLGTNNYSNWVTAGNYSGVVTGDDQFRSVVVISPDNYLLYGKTTGNLGEVGQLADLVFARVDNGVLTSLIQYGATTSPNSASADEPRHMFRASTGKIYSSFHSRSAVYATKPGNYLSPGVVEVNSNGELVKGYQLSDTQIADLGLLTTKHIQMLSSVFEADDKQIYFGFNYSTGASTSGPFISYVWAIDIE